MLRKNKIIKKAKKRTTLRAAKKPTAIDLNTIVQTTSKVIISKKYKQKRSSKQSNILGILKPNFRQSDNKHIKSGVFQKNLFVSQSTKRLFRNLQNLQAHLFRKNLSQAQAKIIKIRRVVIEKKKPQIIPVTY